MTASATAETPTRGATAVSSSPTPVPPASPAANGTLQGYVHIGPTCPVVIEGEDCDDRPYEADLDIFGASGSVVTTVRSGGDGFFRVSLAPGAYTLSPRSDGRLPYAQPQAFVITRGDVTLVDVAYDSGIR